MITYTALFLQQMVRESFLHWRQFRVCINSCLFFLMIVIFFPLTLPADLHLLRLIAPGIIWIALALALFLSAEQLFQQDYEDGVIEQWLVSGYPLQLFVCAKLLVHWWMTILPMLLLCPVLMLLLNLTAKEMGVLVLSLFCGSPMLYTLCALAAAMSTGIKQQGILMALILLPLTLPIMIFGSATTQAAMQALPISGYCALLLAFSLLASALLPFAIAGVIRIGLAD